MPEELDTILRLVAEGTLSPDEAAPIIAALARPERRQPRADDGSPERAESAGAAGLRLRIRVTEGGRQVVNLRIPIGFVDAALRFVPGLGGDEAERIRDAVRAGAVGPILDVDDDGDGVLISVE